MVFVLFTIAPASADCERLFSQAGFLLSARRHRAAHPLLEARMYELVPNKADVLFTVPNTNRNIEMTTFAEKSNLCRKKNSHRIELRFNRIL